MNPILERRAFPPHAPAVLSSIQVGRIAPLGPRSVPSGFVKTRINGRAEAGVLGLAGDEQADLSVHGGPDKAVYAYGLVNYQKWREDFPEHEALLQPGGFGENLTIAALDENSVCIGDVVRIGGAALQVAQPRQPCFKFALYYSDPRMPRAMIRNGRCGWYYSVLQPGVFSAGEDVVLVERPNPVWPVSRLFRAITTHEAGAEDLAELADMPGLAAQWRAAAREGFL